MTGTRRHSHGRSRRLLGMTGALGLFVGVLTAVPTLPAAAAPGDKVQPQLRSAFAAEPVEPFWIRLADKPDLAAASRIEDWGQRGAAVVQALRDSAQRSQAEVVKKLDAAGADYQSFYASNTIYVRQGTLSLATEIARDGKVAKIESERSYQLPKPVEGTQVAAVDSVEWGIDAIGANQVWTDYAARGQGIVVGSIDTGVQFDHPALAAAYRGNIGGGTSHDYNWHDPSAVCGAPSLVPCDDNGHGTHTVGTMVGDGGAGNRIGVAPSARWIAAKGCEDDGCSDFALMSSAEWMLAPTNLAGADPRPELRPHIVNNSWGDGNGPAVDPWFKDILDAWQAAGIFPVFSNGNSGPSCNTSGSPGDYEAAYSVGAFDAQGRIAAFSSRGPGENGKAKPNIAAPGVSVRSSMPGGGYASMNGTSMAAPHVAGTIALLWSAAPSLVGDLAATRDLLNRTAIDVDDTTCGGSATNNGVWGEGKLTAATLVADAPRENTGLLTGSVTDAKTGQPVPGASIKAVGQVSRELRTEADGTYTLRLTTGEYEVQVTAFGYLPKTAPVSIGKGATESLSFSLEVAETATVSGTVTDGSGHGWPLYTKITVAGAPVGPWFTDPVTGRYELTLPAHASYSLLLAPVYPGYQALSVPVRLGSGGHQQDARVPVDLVSCVAPGYAYPARADFEGWADPAARNGWTVTDNIGNGYGWRFDDVTLHNLTGGTGNYASANPMFTGESPQDTTLVSPVMDLSGQASPEIRFNTLLFGNAGEAVARVDLSLDGGQNWANVWTKDADPAGLFGAVNIPVPQAAGQDRARVRLHFSGRDSALWQVDDVTVGGCAPITGGLVTGVVRDDNTGQPLDGVKVSVGGQTGEFVLTAATPEDGNLSDGFYWLFSSATGKLRLNAGYGNYQPASAQVTVPADRVTSKDWRLKAGHLKVSTDSVEVGQQLGKKTTRTVTFTNDGTRPLQVRLSEHARVSGAENEASVAGSPGAPLQEITGDYSSALVQNPAGTAAKADAVSPMSQTGAWNGIASYPTRIQDNAVAASAGKVYSVGGTTNGFTDGITANGYVYDPATRQWSPIAPAPQAITMASGAFVDGTMYVFGGADATGKMLSSMYAYTPATDSWRRVADLPRAIYAAGVAVLDGKLYVVGGCVGQCAPSSNSVHRYDPRTDTWTALADYPTPVSFGACAGITGRIVCAGGIDETSGRKTLKSTYVYTPGTNTWTQAADLPYGTWGMTYSGANGRLQLVGGIINGAVLHNRAVEFDPTTDTWRALPNANLASYRGGGACGMYRVGGQGGGYGSAVAYAEVLAGYDLCEGDADVPWLSVDRREFTLRPGKTVKVKVTFDATSLGQPGDHAAWLSVVTDAPYPASRIAVTQHVDVPKSWGRLSGTVTDAATGKPITNATLTVCTKVNLGHGTCRQDTVTVRTDQAGNYQFWAHDGHLVEVTVSRAGYQSRTESVKIKKSGESTINFALTGV